MALTKTAMDLSYYTQVLKETEEETAGKQMT